MMARVEVLGSAPETPIRYGSAIAWCAFVLVVVAWGSSIGLLHFGNQTSVAPEPWAQLLSGESPFWDSVRQQVAHSGLAQANEAILGPFSDIAAQVAAALYKAVLPEARKSSLHWALLLLTPLIAVALFALRRGRGAKGADGTERPCGLREYLLPAAIYTHRSARVDIGLYLIDRALVPVWIILFVGVLGPFVERHVIAGMGLIFGPSPSLTMNVAWQITYGLATLFAVDLCFFLYHLPMHRTRIGWAIHKVHHSAEVLTPLTRYREHFLEAPIVDASMTSGAMFVSGIFAWLFNGGITQITLLNMGVLSFVYALNANFRHYHVCFRYPHWLEYWLQSPGMHHSHHSRLKQHWDSNLGLFTSIWDRLYGTLYVGDPFESTPWGLPEEQQARCSSLADNLLAPFREFGAMLRPQSPRPILKA